MNIYARCAALLCLVLPVACSDIKDAGEKNFKPAVEQHLNAAGGICFVTTAFPYRGDTISMDNTLKILEVLTKSGLAAKKEDMVPVKDLFGTPKGEKPVNTYELTAEGKKYYKEGTGKTLGGDTLGSICVGKPTSVKIVTFTEPADAMGMKISRVTYTYAVADIPAWAKDPELLKLNRRLAEAVASEQTPIKKTDALILTDKGWIHERVYKK